MKIALRIISGLLFITYILSGFYIIRPGEIGITRLFGKVVNDRVQPGIHYALPWPLQQVDKPKIAEIKRMSVGFKIADQMAGISPKPEEAQIVSGDTNIINIQLMIQYAIKDPVRFIFRVKEPHWLLRKAAEAELTKIIGSMPVDEILTTGKIRIQNETKIRTQELMDRYTTGIHIIAANLQSVEPPVDVINAFKEVSSAKADRERIINEAQSYANDIIPKARGEAEKILRKAEGYKIAKINHARGEADRFLSILKEYSRAKDTTEFRIYLETMDKILPDMKKYVVEGKDNESLTTMRFIFTE